MRITSIHLKNFKAFKKQTIDFSHITLLTGRNSSGKSSVLKALCAVLQTKGDATFPFDLNTNGEFISLGTFSDIAHKRKQRTQSFGIGIKGKSDGQDFHAYGEYRYSQTGREHILKNIFASVGSAVLEIIERSNGTYFARATGEKQLFDDESNSSLYMEILADTFTKLKVPDKDQSEMRKGMTEFLSKVTEINSRWGQWIELPTEARANFYRYISNNVALFVGMGFRPIMQKLANQSAYIAPIREYPKRFYETAELDSRVDSRGRNALGLLRQWKATRSERYQKVTDALIELGMAQGIDAEKIQDDLMRLGVRTIDRGPIINLADVGFGVSQILPVLVADAALSANGVFIVNQPEVHLHPSAQASLGNYFHNRMSSRQYIIETHSEYLLNRFRKLVAEGKLEPSKISIIHFEAKFPRSAEVVVHRITIGKDGELLGAPQDFFDTYYKDAFDIAFAGTA